MFTQNVTRDVLGVHRLFQPLTDQSHETSRIDNASGANDTVGWEGCVFDNEIRGNIAWIGHQQQDGIGSYFFDFLGNVYRDVAVDFGQIQSGLTILDLSTCCNYHNCSIF